VGLRCRSAGDRGRIKRRKRKRRGSERTHEGSERTHEGSERTHDGSERAHGGSEPNRGEHEVPPDESAEEPFDLAARFMEPKEGWWTNYGFESLGAYLRYSETGPDRPASLDPPPKKKSLRAPKLPAAGAPRREPGPFVRTRQVSIRLDEEAYEDLVKAARLYGVAPSTMGRLLVAKGARSAVEGS
jgi:hypothetical protein